MNRFCPDFEHWVCNFFQNSIRRPGMEGKLITVLRKCDNQAAEILGCVYYHWTPHSSKFHP